MFFEGSIGTSGSAGGSNGTGGQGGHAGTCVVKKLGTGEDISINLTANGGQNGKHGVPGESGFIGKNGNDIAVIDRSDRKPSKYYYGILFKFLD
jgi:hypothetical protein